jgi:NarL family two-component system response regulator LiaR
MIRHGVASMLAAGDSMTCVGEASDGIEALSIAPALHPHVIVLDLNMQNADGLNTMNALKALLPDTRFVILAGRLDIGEVRRALAAGASGYLMKTASAEELLRAITAAHKGEAAIAAAVALQLAQNDSVGDGAVGADLTQRERELLALMARGMSNQDISTQLSIAMPTVKFHVTNILAKLHADNRTEAVLIALRSKLVELQ